MKKRPTKTKFYKYMKAKYGKNFCDKDKLDAYEELLDVIQECSRSDENLSALVEITLLGKTDRLIYRNQMAVLGKEMTPLQLDMYISTIEYALEFVP